MMNKMGKRLRSSQGTGGAFLPAGKLFQNEKGHFRGRQGALFPGRVPKKHTFWRSCGNVYLLSNTNI